MRGNRNVTEGFAAHSSGDVAGGVDEGAVPELEHEERPEAIAVVEDAVDVLVEKRLDGLGAEVAARERLRRRGGCAG